MVDYRKFFVIILRSYSQQSVAGANDLKSKLFNVGNKFLGIPIGTLLTFNRLSALSKDEEVIANAVKEAESEIISLSEVKIYHAQLLQM